MVTRDRGQILVIGALGLAFILISIAVALNSGAFTTVLTTSNLDESGNPITRNTEQTKGHLQEILKRTNARTSGEPYSSLHNGFQEQFDAYSIIYTKLAVFDGTLVTQSVNQSTDGLRLYQNEPQSFESADGDTSWEVVENAQSFRDFTLNLSGEQIGDGDNLNDDDTTESELEQRDVFHITFTDDSSNEWSMYFYSRGSDKDIFVRVSYPDGRLSSECRAESGPSSYVRFDLTSSTINSEQSCPQMRIFGNMKFPVTISFDDANYGYGKFSVMVPKTPSEIEESENYGSSPSMKRVLYSAQVTVTHNSTTIGATTTIEIRPNDADGDYYD